MNIKNGMMLVLMAGFVSQSLIMAEAPSQEDFTNFPQPARGAEKDPKLCYESTIDGNATTITTSEAETKTALYVAGGVAALVAVGVVVGFATGNLKVDLSSLSGSSLSRWLGGSSNKKD